jgi:hypothetical protein
MGVVIGSMRESNYIVFTWYKARLPPQHPRQKKILLGYTMSTLAMTPTASTAAVPSILAIPVSEKMAKANYPLWSTQVLPTIHAAQLDDLLTDANAQPEREY